MWVSLSYCVVCWYVFVVSTLFKLKDGEKTCISSSISRVLEGGLFVGFFGRRRHIDMVISLIDTFLQKVYREMNRWGVFGSKQRILMKKSL